jgi:hypothetical protein
MILFKPRAFCLHKEIVVPELELDYCFELDLCRPFAVCDGL